MAKACPMAVEQRTTGRGAAERKGLNIFDCLALRYCTRAAVVTQIARYEKPVQVYGFTSQGFASFLRRAHAVLLTHAQDHQHAAPHRCYATLHAAAPHRCDAARRAMASYSAQLAGVTADPQSLPKIAALLKTIRTQKLRQSQVVATHGRTALQDARRAARALGDDVWAVYEQTLEAALDVDDAPLRDACQGALLKRFGGANPPSQRLERLDGLVAEAAGDWDAALQRYKGVLAQNPANSTALKREVCVVDAKGSGREAVIDALTTLTAKCQSDKGAWQALAEAHVAAYRFADAIFCYEELTLFDPSAQHYLRRLGELYYSWATATTAKREPLYRKARVYFAKSLELLGSKPNARAASGLLLTCSALKLDVRGRKADPDDELNAALGSLAASKLKAAYAAAGPFLRTCNERLLAAHAPPYALLLLKKNEDTVAAAEKQVVDVAQE